MRQRLIQLALWMLKRFAMDAVHLVVERGDLLATARLLTDAQEQFPDRSGEAKNHQVRAALMKAYPAATKRQISLAIEAALA